VRVYVFRIGIFPIAELLLAMACKTPVCIKTFGPRTVEVFRDKSIWIRILAPLNRLVTGALLRRAKVIDVVSVVHKDAVRALYNLPAAKVNVVDNAVDVGLFTPQDKIECRRGLGLTVDAAIVGYVGNLALTRGGAELVRSIAALSRSGRDVRGLIVSGDQSGIGELKALATEMGVEGKIWFRGPVRLEDVPRYIGALDVAISIREDDGCSELKVRQYIACGRPVVVSALVNKFVVKQDLGSLVDRTDQSQITAGIATWLDKLATDRSSDAIALRLSRYATENLDFDFANRERLRSWGLA
jgi:glycosyltransferase involved in cell wall biosynthesis